MTTDPTGWLSTITTSSLHPPREGLLLDLSRRFIDAQRWSNGGPLVVEAEERLAEWHGVDHCVAMSSGFWALVLTAQAIQTGADGSGSEVLMPSLTYRRLADAMNWAGLTPRFVDVDEESLALAPSAVVDAGSEHVGLICAVNPMAGTLDPNPLEGLARSLGVPLLIDSVEAQADFYPDGRRVGGAGSAEVFSCHASKFLNGGEGGYVTTNDAELARRLKRIRSFGYAGPETVVEVGFNAKMSEVQAAWVITALMGVEPQKEYYRAIFSLYQWYLIDVPEIRLRNQESDTSFKNIVVEVREGLGVGAHEVVAFLNAHGAEAREYYAPPLHRKETSYRTITGELPITDKLGHRLMLLPSGSRLSADHVARLSRLLRRFFDGHEGVSAS